MDQAEFTLSRPVCLSLPIEEADKLLQEKDGRCALVYLALLRAGGKPFPAERIGLTERELRQTMERLCALGLVSAAGKEQPAPAPRRAAPADDRPGAAEPKLVPAAELPQYTAEDISARMLSDGPMQTVRREAEQLYGRKLTTPEMNMLLGLRDYLGLPADVLMELIHYVFQEYRAERGHAGTPTMRRIEKEAYAWADQEIHTTAQAEEFLQRRQARRDLAQQVLQVLQICNTCSTCCRYCRSATVRRAAPNAATSRAGWTWALAARRSPRHMTARSWRPARASGPISTASS